MSRDPNTPGFERQRLRIPEIGSRQVIAGLAGAVLYGLVYWLTNLFPLSAAGILIFRPAVAILVFLGVAYGPWAGLLAGFIGHTLGDLLSSGAFYWNWSLGMALIGMVPGFLRIAVKDLSSVPGILKAIGWSTLGIAVGTLFASLMERIVSGIDLRTAVVDYFPLAFLGNFACALVLLPIFMIIFAALVLRREA
jgi:energy-coupling factor transport system substrate-specific component